MKRRIRRIGQWIDKWAVQSNSTPGKEYTVSRSNRKVWGCDCPAWKFKRIECAHIQEVKESLMKH